MKLVIVLAMVGCALAAPRIAIPKRAIILNSFKESVKSTSRVDAKAVCSGKSSVQQSNLATTNDGVDLKQLKGSQWTNLVQSTRADLAQKLATRAGGAKASQNAESNADRNLSSLLGGDELKMVKRADSKATEKVLASGKANTSQVANAKTLQTERISNPSVNVDIKQETSSNLDEKTKVLGGTVKASQNALSKAQKQGTSSNGARRVKIKQSSESQTNEQIASTGRSLASQKADAKASDKAKAIRKDTGETFDSNESSTADSNQQIMTKSGKANASQKSDAAERTSIDLVNKKGSRRVKITEVSNANAKSQLTAKGTTRSQQSENAKAKESQRVRLLKELIEAQDDSQANAADKVKTRTGVTKSSQISQSKSNENVNVELH